MAATIADDGPDAPGARGWPRFGRGYLKVYGASVVANLGDGIGSIAYPWLASAITRNPLLIALVFTAQRLPWLVFSLPAGVITDRVDRRRAIVSMDVARAAITVVVAIVVLARQGTLPAPDALDTVVRTDTALYAIVLLAALLLGMAEVLRDNSAQTILPAVVPVARLEAANGRMWSSEQVANTFIGPPAGSLLLGVAFALPFFANAGAFVLAALAMAALSGTFRARTDDDGATPAPRRHWRVELAEGVRWLWSHPLLRPMALILGFLNLADAMTGAVFVLFAQEVLGVGPLLFAVIGFGAAAGAIIGGLVGSRLSGALGPGACLALTLIGGAVTAMATGLSSQWYLVLVLFGITSFLGIVWNVITVSLRQTIVPSSMLGRVNSVYRFFAWGMMPIGAALGGVVAVAAGAFVDRATALRVVFFVAAAIHLVLFVIGRTRLTTTAIDTARRGGSAAGVTAMG